jgi:hypothetical protein
MFASILTMVLSAQAAQHESRQCSCSSVKVVSWIGYVEGGFGANGLQAQVRKVPDVIRDAEPCPHAKRQRHTGRRN